METKEVKTRDYSIDWLRALGMLAIFSFHVARFFNDGDWHIKNNELSFGLSIYVGILNQFVMPLFFVLSAFAIRYALKKRNGKEFLKERFNRLMIPLLFGILFLIPPQVYIERVSHAEFSGSFWQFLPHYFNGWYGFGGNFAWMGLHLWYLLMLFVFSLILLPLLIRWRGETAQIKFTKFADFWSQAIPVYLLFIPLSLTELFVNQFPSSIGRRDFGSWSPVSYLIIFLLGYLLASDSRYLKSIRKVRFVSLGLSLLLIFTGYYMLEEMGLSEISVPFSLLRGLNTWVWMLTFLGLAGQHLQFRNRFLEYANQAGLPFYILHQTVIVIFGFWIANLDLSIPIKYGLLAGLSFITIISVYEFIIKRVAFLRPLFGMKA